MRVRSAFVAARARRGEGRALVTGLLMLVVAAAASTGGTMTTTASDRAHSVAVELLDVFTPEPGFAGLEIDAGTIHVAWHGSVPHQVSDRVARANGEQVPVKILEAEYTNAELAREAERLVTTTGVSSIHVVAASPRADGLGVNVTVAPGTLAQLRDGAASLPLELGSKFALFPDEGSPPVT